MSFWETTERPLYVMAPMAGVTDTAFRRIWAKYGKPDIIMTEFVSCDGLCSAGREHLMHDLWYDESERPIVAQIFSSQPENVAKASELVRELGFDGIDINAGCPDRSVERQGAGAVLTQKPELLKEIVLAAQRGSGGLPVSVKTRLGYRAIDILEWIWPVLEAGPAALTVHARTRQELSKVPAHWDVMGEVAAAVRERGYRLPILGNGDVTSLAEADHYAATCGLDGIMVGRGCWGNPWFFNTSVSLDDIPVRQRLEVLIEHTRLYLEVFGDLKHFMAIRKHFKCYANGFEDAKDLRVHLLETENVEQVEQVIADFLAKHPGLA